MSITKQESAALSDTSIQWHPAFCAAAHMELSANQADLNFHREYNLSKKPLQIDLLVIKKLNDVYIENEIGHIFRQYNIIEYKSPDDGMTIDDFFKTVGYAYLYKGLGETVNQVPVDQLTVSLFRESYPRELFRNLERYSLTVKKKCSGVYYIEGLLIPAQVVVMRELKGPEHRSLRMLSKHASARDVLEFIEAARNRVRPGDREDMDAILRANVLANKELYKKIRRESSEMLEVIRELFQDEIEAEVQDARQEGLERGMKTGLERGMKTGLERGILKQAQETAYELRDMGLSIDKIAKAVKVSTETVQEWFAGQTALTR